MAGFSRQVEGGQINVKCTELLYKNGVPWKTFPFLLQRKVIKKITVQKFSKYFVISNNVEMKLNTKLWTLKHILTASNVIFNLSAELILGRLGETVESYF